jgi:CRP/FNR family transcriptional regulator
MVDQNRFEAAFRPGEMILKQGSPATHAVFISKGIVRIFNESPGLKKIMLGIALPSEMLVGPGIYTDPGNTYSVSALTDVHACFISLDILNRLVGENAAFAAGMVSDLSEKTLSVHKKLISMIRKKMPGRLAEALLFFANEVYRSDSFEMILTRQELGEMTNMTKESVVRILHDFCLSGIIRSESGRIVIIDRPKLKKISEQG